LTSGSADREPRHQGFTGLVNVRYWHKADIAIVPLTSRIVTSYLVVHKDQILCKRYCKLGRRTLYSGRQQQRGSPYYKSQYEHG
jgi:hypothetical protein